MEITTIGNRKVYIYGSAAPEVLLVQPADDHDLAVLDSEAAEIERLSGGCGFRLAAFKIDDWNRELAPWEAPPVFGDEPFGSGAEETLRYVTDTLMPALLQGADIPVLLGGYSLAGFFALWAGYQTDAFAGINAASPSVWFPGWIDYAAEHSPKSPLIYLSLGDREEKTRNPVMRAVGDNIRRQYEMLKDDPACAESMLEMNPGNHFKEPDIRTAKGFAWLISRLKQQCAGE